MGNAIEAYESVDCNQRGPNVSEETALALRALADSARDAASADAMARGTRFLIERISEGDLAKPAPIGLYFASLWYSEKLYPVIWSVGALGSVLARHASRQQQ